MTLYLGCGVVSFGVDSNKKKDLLKFWHIQDNTCEIFDNISYLSHIFTEGRDSDGHTSGLAVLAILVVMFTDIERIPVSHHLH